MRPLVIEDPNDSLRACVASIFEIPFEHAPRLSMLSERKTWLQQLNEWTMERCGSKWVAAFYMQDEEGRPAHDAIWTPPGWYIEAAETEDGEITAFQCCSGNVVMHRPFQMVHADYVAKMRLWLVVVDPSSAFPHLKEPSPCPTKAKENVSASR